MAFRLHPVLLVLCIVSATPKFARADDPFGLLPRVETKLEGELNLSSITDDGRFLVGMSGDDAVAARWKEDRYEPETLGPVKASLGFVFAVPDGQHLLVQTTSGIVSYGVAPFERKWSHFSGIRAGLASSDGKSLHFVNDAMLCTLRLSDGQRVGEHVLPFLNFGSMAWLEPDAVMVLPGLDALDGSANLYAYDVKSNEFQRRVPLASGADASYRAAAFSQNGRYFIAYRINAKEYEVWDVVAKELVCRIPEGGNAALNPAVSNDRRFAALHASIDDETKPRGRTMGMVLYRLPDPGEKEARRLCAVAFGDAILLRWVIRDDLGKIVALTSRPATITTLDLPD